jgi:hypothetical protein
MPWSGAWNAEKGDGAFARMDYRHAILYYQNCVKLGYRPVEAWHDIAAAWYNLSVTALYRHDYAAFQLDSQQAVSAKVMEQKAAGRKQ